MRLRPWLFGIGLLAGACGRLGFDSTGSGDGGVDSALVDGAAGACASAVLAVGPHTTCLADATGTQCWGRLPAPALASPSAKIAINEVTVCALGADRRIRCWGGDWVGDGTNNGATVAFEHTGTFTDVAAAGRRMCVLAEGSGEVICWGVDFGGPNFLVPTSMGFTATTLLASSRGLCADADGGTMRCLGEDPFADQFAAAFTDSIAPAADITSVVFGIRHVCWVDTAARVVCGGYSPDGQVGQGDFMDTAHAPAEVVGAGPAIAVAAGARHACAVGVDGRVRCWGGNDVGQLGQGDLNPRAVPTEVAGLVGVTSIVASNTHTCATAATGEGWCWGNNESAQWAMPGSIHGTSGSVGLPPLAFEQVDVGRRIACARSTDGEVWCWGVGEAGQLGDGSGLGSTTPVQVALGFAALHVAVGDDFACAANAVEAACWGDNGLSQLGTNLPISHANSPVAVQIPGSIVALDVGRKHACAIASGEVWCWGNALGPFPTAAGPAPVELAVSDHICVRDDDGDVRCWGRNVFGQAGIGVTSEEVFVPTVVMNGAVDLDGGERVTCAIEGSSRDVLCWGAVNGAFVMSSPTVLSLPVAEVAESVTLDFDTGSIDLLSGQRYVFGSVGFGLANDGTLDGGARLVPAASAVGFGSRNGCSIAGGEVTCAGDERRGLLGPTRFTLGTPTLLPASCN